MLADEGLKRGTLGPFAGNGQRRMMGGDAGKGLDQVAKALFARQPADGDDGGRSRRQALGIDLCRR